jgi:hypothetical protein
MVATTTARTGGFRQPILVAAAATMIALAIVKRPKPMRAS